MKILEIRKKIVTKFDASVGLNVMPLTSITPYSKPGYRVLSEFGRIENLTLRTFIYSLPAVTFPSFELTASDSEMQLAAMNFEWNSPRFHLNMVMNDNDTSWLRYSTISIVNATPAPYREFLLGNHELGDNAMIGFQIQNVGHGVLSGSDFISITADLVRTIAIEKISEGIALPLVTVNALATVQILSEKQDRTGFTIFNDGSTQCYLDIVDTVSNNSFMVVIPGGGFYESTEVIRTSKIYAYSDSTTTLHIREFF